MTRRGSHTRFDDRRRPGAHPASAVSVVKDKLRAAGYSGATVQEVLEQIAADVGGEDPAWGGGTGSDIVRAAARLASRAIVFGDGDRGVATGQPKIDSAGRIYDLQGLNFVTSAIEPCAEGQARWDDDSGTLILGLKGGNVCLQVGQEVLAYAKATEDIPNGAAVYVSGASGANAEISLASNDSFDESLVIGLATEDIASGHHGYVTIIGNVNEVDTTGFPEGSVIWLGLNGAWTATRPGAPAASVVLGISLREHASEGRVLTKIDIVPSLRGLSDAYSPNTINQMLLAWNAANARFEEYFTPNLTGFPNRTDSVISQVGATFSIEPAVDEYEIYEHGARYVNDATDSVTITEDQAYTFVYFEGDVLTKSATPWTFGDGRAWAAVVYKDGAQYKAYEERHGAGRNQPWHEWAH